MKFQLALLLVGAFFMAPTPGLAQGMIDYSTLTSEVVSLVRLRLSWTVPSGPITGYNISCGMDLCTSALVVPTVVGNRASSEIQHMAAVNSTLQVFIAAVNGNDIADAGTGGMVPVATFDDARPILRVTVLTSSFFLLDWTLPQTAMGDGISVDNMYSVVLNSGTPSSQTSPFIVDDSRVTPFSGTIQVAVTPTYNMPSIMGTNVAATMQVAIPSADAVRPILNSSASFTEGLSSATTVNWQVPPVTAMLEGYFVMYNVTNLVDGSIMTANGGGPVSSPSTSVVIPACPYCEVVVDVDANYAGSNRAPLLPTSRYVTRQASPSAPRSVNVVKSGVRDLTVTWETPSSPNGVIRNYIVSYTTGGNTRREEVGSDATTYILRNLLPNTQYSIVITGFTAAEDGGEPSGAFNQTTGFGVTSPSSVSVDNLDVTFTLEFDDGPVGRYVIVLSTSSPGNTSSRSTIPAYTTSADFYGTRAATVTGTPTAPMTMTVTIGSGMTTLGGGVSYMDTSLQSSTDYYVFVRAFSSVNETQYSDSAVVSFRTGSGTNIVAIVVPIVVVYILLMVVLIVLGVLAYIYVGKAYKLRKRYQRRKQEAAKRQQQAAAVNLVSGEEGGKDGSASPAPKAEDDPNVQVEVDVEDEKMADQQAEGTDI